MREAEWEKQRGGRGWGEAEEMRGAGNGSRKET